VAAPPPLQIPAITVPGVGAFLSGNPTVAHTWCPTGTIANGLSTITAFYPLGDSVPVQTDVLAATTNGQHILGAAWNGGPITLSDIAVTLPTQTSTSGAVTPATCTVSAAGVMQPLTIASTYNQVPVSNVNATIVDQVVPAPASNLAFITYSGTAANTQLPYYIPGADGAAGTVSYVTLGGSAASSITAPLTGAFSPDGTLFFVSTAGDNLVHYISVPPSVTTATPPTDTQQIAPNLPSCIPVSAGGTDLGCNYSGTNSVVPTSVIVVKPRSTT
jgi:hypothetical protein